MAPPSLVGLPCAGLLLAAPQRSTRTSVLAGVLGGVSIGLLALPGGGRLAGTISAFVVLVTAAFVCGALLFPTGFLRQALRATAIAAAATALLVTLVWGPAGWDSLAWEMTRQAGGVMRVLLGFAPDAYPFSEPGMRFAAATTPAMLALETIAGLALAWQLHARLAPRPLGPPLAPFREFRLADGWVWGVVVSLAALVAPVSGALKLAGANLGFVLGALYLLRGAAVVAAFAQAVGVSAAALAIAGGVAAALALPLLFLVPGLCTLGITDTWFEYRRRLAVRRPPPNAL